ncbi:formate--tetrahydrofolate ligase [Corynebacterium sp. 21KM1197]|uniref:formate--tetrahydrofolate ligase n=1 Tax=Corynebacterium sp. 21KM1197 TaxID=2989734 RepID=UPI0029C9C074|nr:formate--tetrahydrofolate ligase [Corynebacterium sp. 21KM1197]WPF69684.1 formate--tetrahydrofolate ligase [Corynebacterium sp. 21KM1197]
MTLTDVDIAQAHQLEPITEIARRAGIPDAALIPYGTTKAKVDVSALPQREPGKLVLVTGMSPTPAGEGKSTVLIGLADALRQAGYNSIAALREPSQGPVMGIKGGAAGGGYSQVVPMEDINLHFTGDFHAIAAATNTLAALIDNHIHQGNALGIDPRQVTWQRCLDVNDRSLRGVITGLGGRAHGVPTETGFTITAASEIMAVLGLATDAADLKERLGRITVGYTYSGEPVTASDVQAQGALAVLLKDALHPNLVQTLGGTPALVHGGPFANIAHGCNTLLATRTALQCGDVVVTEAGFGSDLGAEKFFDIKARYGLDVAGTVIVSTIRSLKFNGGAKDYSVEDTEALRSGLVNLERHVRNVRKFGVEPVVALNLFSADSPAEREVMAQWAAEQGVRLSEVEVWAKGGAGAADLASAVMDTLGEGSHPLYDPQEGVAESIATIAREIYGASAVEFSPRAKKDLERLRRHGWDRMPVCISKTQYSFSDDPAALGAPEGHTLHVRELLPRTGAGFVVVLTGDVMTMPGLPKKPAANAIDMAPDGTISGLF